jgi:hypothetical protein
MRDRLRKKYRKPWIYGYNIYIYTYIYILILGFLDTCSIPWKYWTSVPAGPGGWGLPLAHLGMLITEVGTSVQ